MTAHPTRSREPKSKSNLWVDYMTVVAGLVIVFAAGMVLTPWVSDGLFGWMFLGETGDPPGASEEIAEYLQFTHGILGAVMIGWMIVVIWLVRGPVAAGDQAAWRALTASIVGWFLIDTTYSLISGFWENAVLNVVFMLAFLPGLAGTRPQQAASA